MSEEKKDGQEVQAESGLDPQREAIYAEFEASQGLLDSKPEKKEEVVAEPAPVEAETVEAKPEAEEEKEPEAPPAEAAKVETKKEEKTVPYDALHEERAKRKEAQAKAKELEERIALLEKSKTTEEEPIDDYDRELKTLRQKLSVLEAKEQDRETRQIQEAQAKMAATLQERVAKTAKELSDAGYPGFEFLSNRVGEVLNVLVAKDPDKADDIAAEWDNPEGWKRIYVEQVFPQVKGVFAQKEKTDILKAKEEAKAKANLAGSPGKSDKPPAKKDEDWGYEDYMKMRMGQSL